MTPVNVEHTANAASTTKAENQAKQSELRRAAEELVGITFFQTLLQTAHNSRLKGEYGHGGRGEEIFTQRFDAILGEQLASSSRFALVDAIYDKLARRYLPDPAGSSRVEAPKAGVNLLG